MANEKRLIEARFLTSQMYMICEACQTENIFIDAIIDEIDNAPTVDAVEVVHSEWILNDDGSGTCKHCHRTTKSCWDYDSWMNYCPNCGAKMEVAEDGK